MRWLARWRDLWDGWRTARERRLPLGKRGERVAARYLRRQGVRVFCRNYRVPAGEVDLIGRSGTWVIFVEVKTRRQGQPWEAVTREKQRRVVAAARRFIARHRLHAHPSRFDVVSVLWPDDAATPIVEHIPNAFQPPE